MRNNKWRNADDQAESERLSFATAKSFVGVISRTSQAEKDNCDLNILVRRFGISPLMSPVDPSRFGDVPELDLREALQIVEDAESAFMELPAKTRERFNNDPLELLAALNDPAREDELRDLGLLRPAANSSSGSPPEAEPVLQEDAPAPGE